MRNFYKMKGLLLKDFYMMTKYCKTYLLLVILFVAFSMVSGDSLFFLFYPCLVSGMVPVTLLGYDERSKWDKYCGTLPYSKAEIVSAKYITGAFCQLLIFVLSGIAQAVRLNISGNFIFSNYLALMSMLLIISCLTASVELPFMFKFGVEKGRIAYSVMLGLICAAVFIVPMLKKDSEYEMKFDSVIFITCLAAIAIYALSWRLSIVFYEKREV